jgi:hypothetical protein
MDKKSKIKKDRKTYLDRIRKVVIRKKSWKSKRNRIGVAIAKM